MLWPALLDAGEQRCHPARLPALYALLQAATSSITGCISCLSLSANLPPCLTACPAALSAADRGGFKTVRQLMDPVIEEMQEAAAGEDDGMLIKAVGVLHKVFGPTSGWSAWPASWRVCLADKRVCVLGLQGLRACRSYVVVHRRGLVGQQAAPGCWRVCSAWQSKRSAEWLADVASLCISPSP